MKRLVLAEKESQALDLKKGLEKYGTFKKGERCFESDNYIITWARGHIMSLQEPRDYDNWGDRKWEVEALPWYPPQFDFKYKVDDSVKTIYQHLRKIMTRNDISEIIVATDAGREGNLIAQELIDHFKLKQPVKRFYDSASMTPKNIQRVIETDLKGEDFYRPRVKASYARAFSDLLLGMNLTIGFSAKAHTLLSMGRVKTPTMAILAQRKKEILDFKEEKFFELEVSFDGVYNGVWFKEQLGNTRFSKLEDIQFIVNKVSGKQGIIIKKEVNDKPENPPLLFNLNSLQGEANTKFGFDPSETLEIAQSLYDTHKILSYPRSESEVIGTEHVKGLPNILDAINIGPYSQFVQHVLDEGIPTTKRMVDDDKLSDHHALIPTEVKPDLSRLNDRERKVYDLVVKRFLAAFYPAAMYEKTEIVTEVEGETFKTSGRIEKDKGWKVLFGGKDIDEDEDNTDKETEAVLPPIEKGESRIVSDIKQHSKKTSAPKLYTYKQLLNIMEKPKRFLQSQELKDALDSAESEKTGLGTSATRGDILKELENRKYIIKKGKNVDITDFGMKLVEVCPEKLKSPEITAEWEGKLRKMELNQYDYDTFMKEIRDYVESVVEELRHTTFTISFQQNNFGDAEVICKCPKCNGDITEKKNVFSCSSHTMDNPCFYVFKEIAKKKISSTIVKELAEKGETSKEIKGFTGGKGKFDARLKFDGEKVVFHFEKLPIGTCPTCGTNVTDKGKVFSCETQNCLVIFKEMSKKQISESVVKELLNNQITKEIKGFIGKNGPFSAKLKLENNRAVFHFENKNSSGSTNQKTDMTCPFCKQGKVQENAKAFGCDNWKGGCKFTVWKNGNAVTLKIIEQLIQNGETGKISGMKAKNGNSFNAQLKLNYANKTVDMIFIND